MATTQVPGKVGSTVCHLDIVPKSEKIENIYQFRRETGESVAFFVDPDGTSLIYTINGEAQCVTWALKGPTREIRMGRAIQIAMGFKAFEEAQSAAGIAESSAAPALRLISSRPAERILSNGTTLDQEETVLREFVRKVRSTPEARTLAFNAVIAMNRIIERARNAEHLKQIVAALEDSRS